MAGTLDLPTLVQKYRLDPTGFQSGSRTVQSENKKVGGSFAGVAKAIAGVGAAYEGIKFLKDSLHAAADEQKNIAVLNRVLSNTGVPRDAIERQQAFLEKIEQTTGHLREETIPAFARLATAHVPLVRQQALFKTALDISTARSLPLVAVTTALGKAYDGNLGALKRLGIQVPANAKGAAGFNAAMIVANKTMGGATVAASKTAAGQLSIMHARLHEVQVRIGQFLIPVLTALAGFLTGTVIPVVSSVVDWFGKHRDVAIAVGVALGVLLGAFIAMKVINTVSGWVKEAKAAWIALNTVMEANPWILVVAAIAAVVAGLIYAYKHVKWFHDFVNAAFHGIVAAGQALWTGLQAAWNTVGKPLFIAVAVLLLAPFLPLIVAIKLVVTHWTTLWGAMKAVWAFLVRDVFGPIRTAGEIYFTPARLAIQTLKHAFDVLGAGIKWVYDHLIKPVLDKVSGALGVIGKVAGGIGSAFGAVGGAVGSLNPFALGGIIPGSPGAPVPILAHGGEGVLTVDTMRALTRDLFGGAGGGSTMTTIGQQHTGNVYMVNVEGLTVGKASTAEDLVRILHQLDLLEGAGSRPMTLLVEWEAADGRVLPLQDLLNGIVILGQVTGLGIPAVLHTSQPQNDEQGEWWQNTRYDKRDVGIGATLVTNAGGGTALRAALRNIARLFNPLRGEGKLRFTDLAAPASFAPLPDDSGQPPSPSSTPPSLPTPIARELRCRYAGGLAPDVQPDDWSDEDWYDIALAFRAFDPWFYDTVDTEVIFQTAGSGVPFFPLFADASDVGPHFGVSTVFNDATLQNIGDGNAWPIWTIGGPGSSIVLTNASTGMKIDLTANGGVTLAPGDDLTIDTRPGHKTVTITDAAGTTVTNVFDRMTDDSALWPLDLGDNLINVLMPGADDTSYVQLAWRNRWLTA